MLFFGMWVCVGFLYVMLVWPFKGSDAEQKLLEYAGSDPLRYAFTVLKAIFFWPFSLAYHLFKR